MANETNIFMPVAPLTAVMKRMGDFLDAWTIQRNSNNVKAQYPATKINHMESAAKSLNPGTAHPNAKSATFPATEIHKYSFISINLE